MIEVCGRNEYYQLLPKSQHDKSNVDPSQKLEIDISSITCFSTYYDFSIYITGKGEIWAIGDNRNGKIISSLPKKIIEEYTSFEIKSGDGRLWNPISVVCGYDYTLYLVSDSKNSNKTCLAYSFSDIKTETPLFVNIGDVKPVSIFGGCSHAAAIDENGSIIFIPESFSTSPKKIEITSLPFGEKAISVVCCREFVISLSSTGRVFESGIKNESELSFKKVEKFENKKIISISGIYDHCFAVCEDGRVFVRGIDHFSFGFLCLGENNKNAFEFTEVIALKKYKIKAAYAGSDHSLFQTKEGKFLGCGFNGFGILHIDDKSKLSFYEPIETSITGDVSFCIAAGSLTIIFKGIDFSKNAKIGAKKNKELDVTNVIKKYEDEISALKAENAKLKKKNSKLRKKLKSKEKEEEDRKTEEKPIVKKKAEIRIIDQASVDEMKQVDIIGRGSQSEVVKVVKEELYALKVLLMSKNAEPSNDVIENFRRLVRENEILNFVEHKNIIKTFGVCFGDENHPPSLLLEYCPYNLNDVVSELSDIERVTTIFELSLAMKEVHASNIIHRDLKPENILLDEMKHVKVSDFGISCVVDVSAQTQSKTTGLGTLKFMAPELLNESSHYDEKVDVYSFGVVVFFILTGGNYPKISIIDVGIGKKAVIPNYINKFSRELINSCWSTDPSERPSFANIIDQIKNNKFKMIDGVEKNLTEILEFLSL